jgi:hydroxyacyl-ACP dehydratase HTD2-like protein with hotdog domain
MFARCASTRNIVLPPCSNHLSSSARWLTGSARLEDRTDPGGISGDDEETTAFRKRLEAMKARKVVVPFGPWNVTNIRDMRRALKSHLILQDRPDQQHRVQPGYHQVCFNSVLNESHLSSDGADKIYEPDEDWKFRVWAGASIEFLNPFIFHTLFKDGIREHRRVSAEEKITNARLVGNFHDQNAKVVVTVTKTLRYTRQQVNGQALMTKTDEVWKPVPGIRVIKEEKHLCFMRTIPEALRSTKTSRLVEPPENPYYSQTMTPTPTLLFRFSALTQNAHLIHLDNHYTRSVYGIPKNLVHGPLTSLLMLEVLNEALCEAAEGQEPLLVSGFSYKNMLPLFVGEEIKICCKKDHDLDGRHEPIRGRSWEQWTVWIQKDTENGPTVAVRGTAVLVPPAGKAVRAPRISEGTGGVELEDGSYTLGA